MVYKYRDTYTTVAGTDSNNTFRVHGICRFFYFEPATATTAYKVTITDADGDIIKFFDWMKGTYREYSPVIMEGKYTITISGATADEDFMVKLLFEEL